MIMIILILIIVLGGGMYAYKELMPPPAEETSGPVYVTKPVTRGDISVGVETVGELQPSNSGGLRVPGSGFDSYSAIIEKFLVEEGDKVKKGQVIAQLKSTDLENQIEAKEDELKNARKDLATVAGVSEEVVDNVNASDGITIVAPIGGMITDVDFEEGEELKLGTIARIVDDSRYEIEAYLYPLERKKVEVGEKVALQFTTFDSVSQGVITKISNNAVPYTSDDDDDGFAQSFAYLVTIEGENEGLIQRDMEVRVSKMNEKGDIELTFVNPAKVKGFINEEKVINTVEDAVVTETHVDNMEYIDKGDPIVTMAGKDTQEKIQEQINKVRELQLDLQQLQDLKDNLEVVAPMDGIVARFYNQEGEQVGARDWIGQLYTVDDMWMWTQVDDIDVLNVQQGAPVKVTVDALPNQSFEGEVDSVSTMGNRGDSGSVSYFDVQIKVKGNADLKPGMQANAFIDAGTAEDVLLVPIEAVFQEEEKNMVEVLLGEQTTKVVPVKLGLMNDRYAEVESGLEEGDQVIVGSSDEVLPSQHIQSEGGLLPEQSDDSGSEGSGAEGE